MPESRKPEDFVDHTDTHSLSGEALDEIEVVTDSLKLTPDLEKKIRDRAEERRKILAELTAEAGETGRCEAPDGTDSQLARRSRISGIECVTREIPSPPGLMSGPIRDLPGSSRPALVGARSRSILIAAVGGSPAVITEGLYALVGQGILEGPVDELHLIGTTRSAERVEGSLLGPSGGLARLSRMHGPRFGVTTEPVLHVVEHPAGTPLEDIRTTEENRAACRQVVHLVRDLVDRSGELHGLVAGGRRTIGLHVALGFQLHGRLSDRIYHVLVPDHAERDPSFFFPVPGSDVPIDLAELPYVRLRELVSPSEARVLDIEAHLDFIQQQIIGKSARVPRLTFRSGTSGPSVEIDGRPLKLEPRDIHLWERFATLRASCRHENPVSCHEEFLSPATIPVAWGSFVVPEDPKLTASDLRSACSRITRGLKALGIPSSHQDMVKISRIGRRGDARYGISLRPDSIHLQDSRTGR